MKNRTRMMRYTPSLNYKQSHFPFPVSERMLRRKSTMIKTLSISTLILTILAAAPNLHADDSITLTSPNGQYSLTAPKGWGSADFKVDDIQIGASNPHRGEYAEVVAVRQEDYAGSLKQFAEAKRDTMAMSLDNPRIFPGQRLKLNKQDAYRFEIRGQLPNTNVSIAYVLTVLATKTHYIQIVGWTEESHLAENQAELYSLSEGFSENSAAAK